MTAPQPTAFTNSNLYDKDFYLWIETTAKHLKEGNFTEVDLANLVEEIESMGRSEKRAVRNILKVLLIHLLKYKYQPELRSNSWRYTIIEHRNRLQDAFNDSPSLKPYYEQVFDESYQKARLEAAAETGLSLDTFPLESPFTPDECLERDFLPD